MKTIKLTNGLITKVDNTIYDLVKNFRWYAIQNGAKSTSYPAICIKLFNGKWRNLRLHHVIMGQPLNRKLQIDHIDNNGLNNQRKNLRIVTPRENSSNSRKRRLGKTSSKYVGVHLFHGKYWSAKIDRKHLGYFKTEQEASKVYQQALRRIICQGGI